MKYKIKLRKTIVLELYTEVEDTNVVSAMNEAEQKYIGDTDTTAMSSDVSSHETEWVAVSVNTEE